MEWEIINITDIGGFRIGNAQDYNGMTGVTVIIFDKPNVGGIDISGGGPVQGKHIYYHLLLIPTQ